MLSKEFMATLHIDHLVLVVSDLERTRTFYSRIFGDPDYENGSSLMYADRIGGGVAGREKIWLDDPDKIRIEFFIYE